MSHYVITIDIKHVVEKQINVRKDARYDIAPATERVVEDVTHVVTKAEQLGLAVEKATSILRLEKSEEA